VLDKNKIDVYSMRPRALYVGQFLSSVILGLLSLPVQGNTQRPHILGLAHVAFRVSNMDRTTLFYESVRGYEEPFSLNDENGKITTAFVKVNDQQYVELFPVDTQTPSQLDHFALYTDDLTAMRAYVQSLGMYIVKDIHKGRIGNPYSDPPRPRRPSRGDSAVLGQQHDSSVSFDLGWLVSRPVHRIQKDDRERAGGRATASTC
jgi:hypothetical protein